MNKGETLTNNKPYRILLVEDEEHLSGVVALNLELEGYHVDKSEDGANAIDLIQQESFDLIVLDVMLPGMHGFEVCRRMREEKIKTPVLMISAKGNSTDRIHGLKSGADDYLPKPFDLEELLLRVAALLRRSAEISEEGDGVYNMDGLTINIQGLSIKSGEESFELSAREARVLDLLIRNADKAVSRDEILRKCWTGETEPTYRTIDNLIVGLRKKLREKDRNKQIIRSVRGVGYVFSGNLSS